MKSNVKQLSLAISTVLVTTAASTQIAYAQAALQEVVVTARKQEESIQSVPVAITSLGADELAAQSTFNVNALSNNTPSMNITIGAGDPNSSVVALRGQVQNDTLLTLDPSVGIYLDDVYLGHAVGANLDMFDMDRVEILAGPQGTLYGRNTTGGAIKLLTNKADPSQGLTGYVSQTLGNYRNSRTEAAVNIPLVDDVLALRVAGLHQERDGYGTYTIVDPTTQAPLYRRDAGDKNIDAARLSLVFNATDKLVFTLAGDYMESRNNGAFSYNLPGDVRLSPTSYERSSSDFYEARANFPNKADARVWGGSLTMEYAFDFADFKLVYAHRDVDTGFNADIEGTSALVSNNTLIKDVSQDTLELQLTGLSLNDRLTWVAGLYYFEEEGIDFSTVVAASTPPSPQTRVVGGTAENNSFSPYVHTTYAFTDDLNVTIGVRYTEDEKEFTGHAYNPPQAAFPTGRCIYTLQGNLDLGSCFFNNSKKYHNVSYTAGMDYRINSDIMVYLKRNTGYRSGGQNLRGYDAATQRPFDEETISDWEVGIKSTLLDQRLRLNAAVYRSDYEDIQVSNIRVTPFGTTTAVDNQGEATVDGAELQISVLATDDLKIDYNGSYTDFDYKDSGLMVRLVPLWKHSIAATYTLPVNYGSWSFRAGYTWRDEYYNNSSKATIAADPYATTKSLGLIDARVAVTIDRYDMDVALFGTNLAGKEYYESPLVYSPPYLNNTNVGEPRMFGIEAKKRF